MRWSAIREAVAEVVRGFDPARMSVASAEEVLREVTVMRNLLGVAGALAAARVAESDRWREAGARTPAEHLSRQTGVSTSEARRALTTGCAIAEQPIVLDAALAGALSPVQAALLTEAVQVAPDEADRLVDLAARTSLAELRTECARVRATADPDPDATYARVHAGRRLQLRQDPDGTAVTTLRGTPTDQAWLASVLTPLREEMLCRARRTGQRLRADAADYDALLAVLRQPAGADPSAEHAVASDDARPGTGLARGAGRRDRRLWSRATVIVRVDAAAAERGHPQARELCEVTGAGPIPVQQVQAMLSRGAALAVVTTRGERVERVAHVAAERAALVDIRDRNQVLAELARTGRPVAGVAHAGRRPTTHQLTALRWTSPTCTVEDCPNPRCDIDHRTGWALTHTTRLGDLDPLCRHHHNLKTRANWALVPGHGPRPFVAPQDPRHPRRTRAG